MLNPKSAIDLITKLSSYRCRNSLAEFTKDAWSIIEPGTKLVWNWHLDTICGYLEAFHLNQLPNKRLIINIPPGMAKSILVSVMYPAWCWISAPHLRFLAITSEQKLSIRDSLRMKLVVSSSWYQSRFDLTMSDDQNEKTLFVNNKGGFRQSQGITANITGKRGDVVILDDVVDARKAFSDAIRNNANDTWDQSISSRLNDLTHSGVILVMQRLHEDDLTGHLLRKVHTHWTHLVIPMRYEGKAAFNAGIDIQRAELNDPRTTAGELLFPAKFPESAIKGQEELLGDLGIAGQFQQRPYTEGGGIIKQKWWRVWPDEKPIPKCVSMFLSYDTAFSEKDSIRSAYSAMTRWGVFWHEQKQRYCMMLLGCWYERIGYEELRKLALEWDTTYEPDLHLIEKKATGITLIQDLKRALPGKVYSYTPKGGEDKISRAYSVSPLFEAGLIYSPNKKFAVGDKEKKIPGVIQMVAAFPKGSIESFDITDTVTQACIYMRQHWHITMPDDDHLYKPKLMEEKESPSFYG